MLYLDYNVFYIKNHYKIEKLDYQQIYSLMFYQLIMFSLPQLFLVY